MSLRRVVLLAAVGFVAVACSGDQGGGGGPSIGAEDSFWFQQCVEDSDCGGVGFTCQCGICVAPCDDNGNCAFGTCQVFSDIDSCEPADTPYCYTRCTADVTCQDTLGSSFGCVDGTCAQLISDPEADAGPDVSTSDVPEEDATTDAPVEDVPIVEDTAGDTEEDTPEDTIPSDVADVTDAAMDTVEDTVSDTAGDTVSDVAEDVADVADDTAMDVDDRTCAEMPCYPGAVCTDLDVGFRCGQCPDDLAGDGITCTDPVGWLRIFGDDNDDQITGGLGGGNIDLVSDAEGNAYVIGTFGADFAVGGDTYTFDRFGGYVASFDADGAFRWSTGYGVDPAGTGDLSPLRGVVLPGGDIVTVGTGWGGPGQIGGEDVGPLNPGNSGVVARLDADDGSVVWTRVIAANVHVFAEALAVTPEGNLVAGGTFQGDGGDFGAGFVMSSAAPTVSDGFAITLDVDNGSTLDLVTWGSAAASELTRGVVALPDGDLFVVGTYNTAETDVGGIVLPHGLDQNLYFARLDADGVAAYAIAAATDNYEGLDEVRLGPSGDVYVSGYYTGETTIDGTVFSGGANGMLLGRVDVASGEFVWLTGTQGSGNAPFGLRRFIVDEAEQIRVGVTTSAAPGNTFGTDDAPFLGSGVGLHVFSVDGDVGIVTFHRYVDMAAAVWSNAIALTPEGHPMVAGSVSHAGTLYGVPFELAGAAGYDQFLLRFNGN